MPSVSRVPAEYKVAKSELTQSFYKADGSVLTKFSFLPTERYATPEGDRGRRLQPDDQHGKTQPHQEIQRRNVVQAKVYRGRSLVGVTDNCKQSINGRPNTGRRTSHTPTHSGGEAVTGQEAVVKSYRGPRPDSRRKKATRSSDRRTTPTTSD